MGEALILSEKERNNLLSQIDSRETYNSLMAFLDTVKQSNNYPYTTEEYRTKAIQSISDAKNGKGTSIEDMRKIHPR